MKLLIQINLFIYRYTLSAPVIFLSQFQFTLNIPTHFSIGESLPAIFSIMFVDRESFSQLTRTANALSIFSIGGHWKLKITSVAVAASCPFSSSHRRIASLQVVGLPAVMDGLCISLTLHGEKRLPKNISEMCFFARKNSIKQPCVGLSWCNYFECNYLDIILQVIHIWGKYTESVYRISRARTLINI